MHVRCHVRLSARWGCPLPGRSTPLGPMTGMGAVSAGSLCSPAVIEWFDRFAAVASVAGVSDCGLLVCRVRLLACRVRLPVSGEAVGVSVEVAGPAGVALLCSRG